MKHRVYETASGRLWCVTAIDHDSEAGWTTIRLGAVALGKLMKVNTREKHRLHLAWNGQRWADGPQRAWCTEHEPDLLPMIEADLLQRPPASPIHPPVPDPDDDRTRLRAQARSMYDHTGQSIRQIATALGIPRSTIHRWVRDEP